MKKLLLLFAAVGMIFTACKKNEVEEDSGTTNSIFYTTTDNERFFPNSTEPAIFGAIIVSNTYKDGKGVIKFDGEVTTIGANAFKGCTTLASITIPNSVIEINEYAFSGCYNLTSITIPDSVTSIGRAAFSYCSNLTNITIGNGVTEIKNSAFWDCSSLKNVTIPDSVSSIGSGAFWDCSSLTNITIGNSVTEIGVMAFSGCTNLIRFYGKFTSADHLCLIVDGVLNSFALGCGATKYTIPDSVTKIGREAFEFCSSLTSVTIPESVTKIEIGALAGCRSLKEVYCKSTTPPTGDSCMFDGNASGRKIYVPTASEAAYRAALGWSDYASDIVGFDF